MAGKKKKGNKKKVHKKHQKNLHKGAMKAAIDEKMKIDADENNSKISGNEDNRPVFTVNMSNDAKLTMHGCSTLFQSATIKNSDGVVISHGLDVYDSCVQVVGDELVVTPIE